MNYIYASINKKSTIIHNRADIIKFAKYIKKEECITIFINLSNNLNKKLLFNVLKTFKNVKLHVKIKNKIYETLIYSLYNIIRNTNKKINKLDIKDYNSTTNTIGILYTLTDHIIIKNFKDIYESNVGNIFEINNNKNYYLKHFPKIITCDITIYFDKEKLRYCLFGEYENKFHNIKLRTIHINLILNTWVHDIYNKKDFINDFYKTIIKSISLKHNFCKYDYCKNDNVYFDRQRNIILNMNKLRNEMRQYFEIKN